MDAQTTELLPQQFSWIPINLLHHAQLNELIEELRLYIALKLYFSGKIRGKKSMFKPLKELHGAKSHHTFDKRLERLQQLNWIGYNSTSDYYFIRSYERVCSDLGIRSETCAEFETKHLKHFRIFVFAAIVGKKIKSMEYAKRKRKGEHRLVPKYWERTNPSLPLPFPDYVGLPVSTLVEMTGKARSWCSELKNLAEKVGLLKTKEKLITVDIVPKNPYIREGLKELYPNCYGRFRTKIISRGKYAGMVRILEQLPDEITPLIRYRKRRR
ncbi:hypothetical protein ACFS7Z_07040 [Pontibacter toksunensis]|uniref:Uncharacterized protein n=1 Tax=Pontibacter toksunensis TaxID=1332631 RepID=A0ABW6BUM3_9BACT